MNPKSAEAIARETCLSIVKFAAESKLTDDEVVAEMTRIILNSTNLKELMALRDAVSDFDHNLRQSLIYNGAMVEADQSYKEVRKALSQLSQRKTDE